MPTEILVDILSLGVLITQPVPHIASHRAHLYFVSYESHTYESQQLLATRCAKAYLLSCLTKLAKLLCLKWRGRTFFVNSVFCSLLFTCPEVIVAWAIYVEDNEAIAHVIPPYYMTVGRVL